MSAMVDFGSSDAKACWRSRTRLYGPIAARSLLCRTRRALERREVKIGQDTADMFEVTRRIDEGELVALDPPDVTTTSNSC